MRYALTDISFVRRLLRSRWPQWLITLVTLAVFVVGIFSGLFGTPAGNRNFGIVFVWIVWWGLLILLMIPVAGRFWCSVCPIPAPGEWLQRRALVAPRAGGRLYTLGLKWPRWLRNIWAQNFGFLGVALFSTVILTTPRVTASVLLGFVVIAIATSLLFERRTFCRYLCPVGGFIGLYSQLAPIEIRVRDPQVCLSHREKTCYTGSDDGYGCPWLLFPGGLEANTFCGMCTECLRTCPKDNVALYLREPAKDLRRTTGRHLDEAFKALIMLSAALIYALVLIGPYGGLKTAARSVGSGPWALYALSFIGVVLFAVPGLFWSAVHAGKILSRPRDPGSSAVAGARTGDRALFADYATSLIPLGLALWAAFSLSFVLVNVSYAWSSLSDPLGWGWNLFGTAGMGWIPYVTGLVPFLQVPVLLVGLYAAVSQAVRTAVQHGQRAASALPVSLFCTVAASAMLYLLIGS